MEEAHEGAEGQHTGPIGPKEVILGILGNLNALPISIWVWLYLLILILKGQVEEVKRGRYLTIIVDLQNDAWLCRSQYEAKGWAGNALGNCTFVVDDDGERWQRTVKHENRHNLQMLLLGVLQPVLYGLASAFIWVFLRALHSYYDNPFERDARRAAGQPVLIPRKQWMHGPRDRWAWW